MFSFVNPSYPKLALSLTFAVAFACDALASTHPTRTLPQMMTEADFVFEGTVVHIDHRVSDVVSAGDVVLPHTFVTFQIEEVVKGSSDSGNTITLRFLGGPDGKGRVLGVAGLPQFRAGDHDMLFVKKNGEMVCPLVGWEFGRLRIVRGELYDALGGELWMTPGGEFVPGPKVIDVDAENHPPVSKQVDPAKHEHDEFAPPVGAWRADAAGMREVLRFQWATLKSTQALEEPKPAKSARISDSFRAPQFTSTRSTNPATRALPAKSAPKHDPEVETKD
jgi:hypothetical protein